mgnify:CR=1 FL=1
MALIKNLTYQETYDRLVEKEGVTFKLDVIMIPLKRQNVQLKMLIGQ